MMKAWIVGAGTLGAVALLTGCGPDLAQTPVGEEEAAWQRSFRQNYSSYRPPRTAPPATVDSVSEKLRRQEEAAAGGAPVSSADPIPAPSGDDPGRIVDNAAEGGAPAPAPAPAPESGKPAAAPAEAGGAPAAAPAPAPEAGKSSFTATPPDPTGGTVYEVKAGDTLSAIAKRFYGSAGAAGVIERANVDLIKNPNRLRPGMKLIIPKL